MAGKGISINFLANVRDFLRGTEDAEEAFEKVSDSLDDIARDGDKATEKLERSFKDLSDASKREAKKVGDNFESNSRRGFGRATEAARSFKDEARQNFAEVASSFDGTTQGIADGIQGTLGGAAVAVGGAAGLAIGALGIVGGTVLAQITKDAEASEQRTVDMYAAMLESRTLYLTNLARLDAAEAITGDPAKLAEAQATAKKLGLDLATVILAQVSAGEERNAVQSRINELLAEQQGYLDAATDGAAEGADFRANELATLEQLQQKFQGYTTEQNKSAAAAAVALEITEKLTGQQQLTNEEIQIQNRLLAQTPTEVATKLIVDRSELDRALERRTLRIDIDGYTRTGQKVI